MDSKQLVYFKTLYASGNITQTAKELYLTRQALSLSIRKLEQEIGAELFTRTSNGLIPTEAAHILHHFTKKQEDLWHTTLQQIQNVHHQRTFRIAIHIMYCLPDTIRRMITAWQQPDGYRFSLTNITDSGQAQTLLENDNADIAITHKPPHTAKLSYQKMYESEAWLIMQENDILAQLETVDFTKDLRNRLLLFPSKETLKEMAPIIISQGGSCTFVESDRILLSQSLFFDNSLVIFPEQSLDNFLQPGLTARKLTHFPVTNGIYIIYRNNDPEIKQAVDYIKKFFFQTDAE